MEDGDISSTEISATINADQTKELLNKMANYPDVEVTVIKNKNNTDCKASESSIKVNGESDKFNSDEQDEYTSDEDILIIDEEYKKDTKSNSNHKRVRSPSPRANFKGFKKRIISKSLHFLKLTQEIKKTFLDENESIVEEKNIANENNQGELYSTISNEPDSDNKTGIKDQKGKKSESLKNKHTYVPNLKSSAKKLVKKRPSQKLTEYAQYLGLQPAVKFKCVKCSESSFPSLSSLNEHQIHCLAQPSAAKPAPSPASVTSTPSSTNFRVTRKVFLCSSCGTYYENCNLFLHMREVHRRYICLYCLGMFSLPEKLSHHLVTKHNCSPDHYSSADDFLSSYRESCFLVCCHCETVFSERDNFFHHICMEKRTTATHSATCKANTEQSSATSSQNQKTNNKSTHQKTQKHKTSKSSLKTPIAPTEHVTADSPSTSLMSTEVEKEVNAAEHFMADVSSSYLKNNSENSTNMSVVSSSPAQENKDVNENNFESNLVTNESEKNLNIEPTSDLDKSTEEKKDDDLDEVNENKHEEDKQSITKSDIMEDRKSDHDDDNNDNILPEDNSDSAQERLSQTKNNNSDVENMQCDNNLDTKNVDGNETNDLQSTSENKEVNQISSDAELSNNEIDEEDEQNDNSENINENDNHEINNEAPVEETRKVPKVTLKLPPQGLIYSDESDDSEKLTMEVDENCESDNDCDESQNASQTKDELDKPVNGIDDNEKDHSDHQSDDEMHQVAGEDVPIVELELEQPLDKFNMESLLKICLGATISICIYCNHARKIAVNGKQLGLHAIAEHRFSATVNSITAEELIPKNFIIRIKESLEEVESAFFSLEEKEQIEEIKDEDSTVSSFKRIYECFQCRYATTIHKELYLHNRKMHAKTILLCIMCKSNFYSYSELICHLCPGNYVLNSETKFRCCMCDTNDLPSAFRLMVHLRKKHHTCDVCLEGCQNQSKLSNHVWKHKLHHLCYRCGIAYRNKPDITKHLFWKHGTESVLCKKCLQKKWPHVYHFCIPPVSFVCEECSLSFSKAVYLKVHKRLHNNEKPHACTEENCTEKFISKKLVLKHEMKHREPVPIDTLMEPLDKKESVNNNDGNPDSENSENKNPNSETTKQENRESNSTSPGKEEAKAKNLIDVYDLPALNLSESDSDESDEEKVKPPQQEESKPVDDKVQELPDNNSLQNETSLDEEQKPVPILDGIWDNFKNYQATLEKKEIVNTDLVSKDIVEEEPKKDIEKIEEPVIPDINVILADHDYCITSTSDKTSEMEVEGSIQVKNDESTGLDHDYCTVSANTVNDNNTNNNKTNVAVSHDDLEKKKLKTVKKKTSKHNGTSSSSESSSDSESSSCTCGSNCSCSSSSGSSSSSSSSSDSDSSSSEGKRRIQARRERRKERAKRKKESEASNTSAVDVVATEDNLAAVPIIELPIEESDLDTDETETDEDFYDEHPQRLANKILAEKRNQLAMLAAVAPVTNGTILECSRPSTPSIPEEASVLKKKMKSKKRKKKSRSSTPKQEIHQPNIPIFRNHQSPLAIQSTHPVPSVTPAVPSPLSNIHPLPSSHIPHEKQKIRLPSTATTGSGSETENNVRSSKRRRVPNKFYGYSSDEESTDKVSAAPVIKWRKSDLPATPSHVTASPQFVPPITIKNIPSPAPVIEPIRAPVIHHNEVPDSDSDADEVQHRKSSSDSSDSNRNDDSDSDTGQLHISHPPYAPGPHHGGVMQRSNENLYCYCQCPYDEVSEMIACDGRDCAIEWFHFECVGIMVPPKGKWFCPDCRKKSMARNDIQI